jgi:hypothetical protein
MHMYMYTYVYVPYCREQLIGRASHDMHMYVCSSVSARCVFPLSLQVSIPTLQEIMFRMASSTCVALAWVASEQSSKHCSSKLCDRPIGPWSQQQAPREHF